VNKLVETKLIRHYGINRKSVQVNVKVTITAAS